MHIKRKILAFLLLLLPTSTITQTLVGKTFNQKSTKTVMKVLYCGTFVVYSILNSKGDT